MYNESARDKKVDMSTQNKTSSCLRGRGGRRTLALTTRLLGAMSS